MIRKKVILRYDGSGYNGWQKQTNGIGIQEIIEKVLETICSCKVEIHASGRTDAKVHALGQVFHFDTSMQLTNEQWKCALNRLLPPAIRIVKVEDVDHAFHARFDAIKKQYDYYISLEKDNPFVIPYMEIVPYDLDINYMRECAKIFLGTHDFTSFTSAKINPLKSRVKTIYKIDIVQKGNTIIISIIGDGFLRYMVRMIVQTLMEAGRKKISDSQIQQMLEKKDKNACRYKAVANGLYLVKVWYGGEEDESELSYTYHTMSSCERFG